MNIEYIENLRRQEDAEARGARIQVLCEHCDRGKFPRAVFSKHHVSEGHFAGNLGDVRGQNLPDRFTLRCGGREINLDEAIACHSGDPGWVLLDAAARCGSCHRPMLKLMTGEVTTSFPVPMDDDDIAASVQKARKRFKDSIKTRIEI